MTRSFIPAIAAVLLLCSPAFAHMGIIHEGCASGRTFAAGDISVTGAFTRATLPAAPTAGGYFTIANAGATPDRLLGADTEAATKAQVHSMSMDNSMMKMALVEGGLEIPAGGSVSFDPSSYHLMLLGLKQPFKEGACLKLTLHLEKAGDLPIELNIGSTAAQAAPDQPAPAGGAMDMGGMPMDHEMAPAK